MPNFIISLTFGNSRSIDKLCFDDDAAYWLSWNIFDKTYQSEPFHVNDTQPFLFRDTIHIQCDLNTNEIVPAKVLDAFPIRIFFCTTDIIIAEADINPFIDRDERDSTYMMPFENSDWFDFTLVLEGSRSLPHAASINVGILIIPENSVQLQKYGDAVMEGRHLLDQGSVDYGEDDDFEEENSGDRSATATVEVAPRSPPPPPSLLPQTQPPHRETSQPQQKSLEDNEDNKITRHFRVSVDVRTIGGLKRPAHVSVQYVYPYLGASTPVRSHPVWIQAFSEAKIDGAVASYECAMSRERLADILSNHPIKMTVMSKSHLGNNIMGEVTVDLSAANMTEPHSYRCPVTARMFKTIEEYSKHRQIMLALMAAGRIDRAPAKDPVIIRLVDTYLTVMPVSSSGTSTANVYSGGSAMPGDPTAKVRVVIIIEDIGAVGAETAIAVRPGYKQHNGALYQIDDVAGNILEPAADEVAYKNPLDNPQISPANRAELEKLRLDWEAWRKTAETHWREKMIEKEDLLRKKVEADGARAHADRADDLRRAQEEVAKLEIRLKGAIDTAERQKNQLTLKEEQMQMKLAQKTSELQLLQRRVREEAKSLIETEKHRADTLAQQLSATQESLKVAERRTKITEEDFEAYRARMRGTPEAVLREENAKLRAQLGETKAEIERERRMRTETALEKEHFRAQMHRLALALKREREKSSGIARQELEQLRLEFLAREERYILDGDREELRTIRHELASLKSTAAGSHGDYNHDKHPSQSYTNPYGHRLSSQPSIAAVVPVAGTPFSEEKTSSPPRNSSSSNNIPTQPRTNSTVDARTHEHPLDTVARIRSELVALHATGLYSSGDDPVVATLLSALRAAEAQGGDVPGSVATEAASSSANMSV